MFEGPLWHEIKTHFKYVKPKVVYFENERSRKYRYFCENVEGKVKFSEK